MSYYSYPPSSGGSGGTPIHEYANFAAFPSPVTAGNGALALALDTGNLYESNGTVWRLIAGPGVALSIGTFDSGTPSVNGAHIDSNSLIMQSASAIDPGLVNISTQTFAGNKTFTGTINAANLTGQNSGDAAVVFRPGGPQGGVVYNNWTDLYAAIVTLDIAHVFVTFDNSLASCNIPAGSYFLGNVFFEAILGTILTNPIVVTLEDGCVFTAFPGISNLINLVSISTTPVFVPSNNYLIGLQFAGNISSTTGAPLIQVPNGFTLLVVLFSDSSLQGNAGFPVIELLGNATLFLLTAEAANFGDNVVKGGATSSLTIVVENPTVTISSTQTDFSGTTSITYQPQATNMTFGLGLGDLIYANTNGQGTILPADTTNTKKFLSQQSIAGSPQAPVWATISSTDMPALTGDVTSSAGSTVTTVAKIQGNTVSGSTGTVNVVFSNSPTLVTPNIGAATGTSLNLSGLTASQAVVTDASKNLVSLLYTSNNTNSSIVSRDSNGNSSFNNVVETVTTTVTSGQIISMNAGSASTQIVTGTSNITFNLPNATTLVTGTSYLFNNNSTGTITINLFDGTTLLSTVGGGGFNNIIVTNNSTTNGVWDFHPLLTHSATSSNIGTSVPGSLTAANQLISQVATGTPPLVVSSTTQVANLNVATAGNITATSNSTLTTLTALTTASSLASVGTITSGTWSATTIAVNKGGTGLTSGTSGGILGFTGSTTIASSAALTASQLIIGGGAGATPSTLAAGTQGQILQMNATPIPAWTTIASITISGVSTSSHTGGFPANSSGVYTPPAGVKYIIVELVGPGGSGGGGGVGGAGGNGVAGLAATTFSIHGGALLASGGAGGFGGGGSNQISAVGGAVSVSSPAIGILTLSGARGSSQCSIPSGQYSAGGNGASNPMGIGGTGIIGTSLAGDNATGFGAGGGGGSGNNTSANQGGAGGSSGGYCRFILYGPLVTYDYVVGGASGTVGTGTGTGAGNGGLGSGGGIICYEFYI